jgi:hypothetical protein
MPAQNSGNLLQIEELDAYTQALLGPWDDKGFERSGIYGQITLKTAIVFPK